MTPDQQFVIALLTVLSPILSSVIVILGGALAFWQQSKKIKEVKEATVDNGAKVEQVHKAVNSERTVMVEELKRLLTENGLLAGADKERKEVAAAAAAAAPSEVVIVNPDPVKVTVEAR